MLAARSSPVRVAIPDVGVAGLTLLMPAGNRRHVDCSYTIQAQLHDVVCPHLTPGLSSDVNGRQQLPKNRGSDWHALFDQCSSRRFHLGLRTAPAKVGRTILLGSMHIELEPPRRAAAGERKNGSVIPLSSSGHVSHTPTDPGIGI